MSYHIDRHIKHVRLTEGWFITNLFATMFVYVKREFYISIQTLEHSNHNQYHYSTRILILHCNYLKYVLAIAWLFCARELTEICYWWESMHIFDECIYGFINSLYGNYRYPSTTTSSPLYCQHNRASLQSVLFNISGSCTAYDTLTIMHTERDCLSTFIIFADWQIDMWACCCMRY